MDWVKKKTSQACKVLGVDQDASKETVKKAYLRLSLLHHPDKNGGSEAAKEKFQEISDAKDWLLGGLEAAERGAPHKPSKDRRNRRPSEADGHRHENEPPHEDRHGKRPADNFKGRSSSRPAQESDAEPDFGTGTRGHAREGTGGYHQSRRRSEDFTETKTRFKAYRYGGFSKPDFDDFMAGPSKPAFKADFGAGKRGNHKEGASGYHREEPPMDDDEAAKDDITYKAHVKHCDEIKDALGVLRIKYEKLRRGVRRIFGPERDGLWSHMEEIDKFIEVLAKDEEEIRQHLSKNQGRFIGHLYRGGRSGIKITHKSTFEVATLARWDVDVVNELVVLAEVPGGSIERWVRLEGRIRDWVEKLAGRMRRSLYGNDRREEEGEMFFADIEEFLRRPSRRERPPSDGTDPGAGGSLSC